MKGYKEEGGWRIVAEAPTLSYLYSIVEDLERWGFEVDGFNFHPHKRSRNKGKEVRKMMEMNKIEIEAIEVFKEVKRMWEEKGEYDVETDNKEKDLVELLIDFFEQKTGQKVDWGEWYWSDDGTAFGGYITTKIDKKYLIYIDENGIEIEER